TTEGNTGSGTMQVAVLNNGDPGSSVNWTATVVQGVDVVTLSKASGSSTPGNPSSFGIGLTASAAGTPGGKFALLQVRDASAQNGTQFVVVVADVAAAGTLPDPDPDPEGLAFFTAGAAQPPAQQVTVNNNSATPVGFSVSASTNDGASWLSAKSA